MKADTIITFIFSLPGLFVLIILGVFLYLIQRRIQIKETEDFEKRDN